MRRLMAIVGAATMSLLATRCPAEDAPGLSTLGSSPAFQQSVLQRIGKPALAAGQRGLLGDKAPPSAAAYRVYLPQTGETVSADLVYQPSDGISRTLRKQLAARAASEDPSRAREIFDVLATDAIWQQFDQSLTGLGLSSRNLADVMTSYYVASWQIVNRLVAQPRAVHAVRDQLANSLRHSPEIIFMSDAEKQRTSEALGILTTAVEAGSRATLGHDDPIGFLTLQLNVQQSLLDQGIDLKRLKLTGRGFVPM